MEATVKASPPVKRFNQTAVRIWNSDKLYPHKFLNNPSLFLATRKGDVSSSSNPSEEDSSE